MRTDCAHPFRQPSSRLCFPRLHCGRAVLVLSKNTKQSPAVLAKLCACSGALIADMPYAAMVPRGGSGARVPRRTGGGTGGESRPGGRAGVEESLGDLLRALARLAMDVAAEPSARIAGACLASTSSGRQLCYATRSDRSFSAASCAVFVFLFFLVATPMEVAAYVCTTARRCRDFLTRMKQRGFSFDNSKHRGVSRVE